MNEWEKDIPEGKNRISTGRSSYGKSDEASQSMPAGPYYSSIKHELEMRRDKVFMELQLVESALKNLTPEIE